MESTSYLTFAYDELPDAVKRRALRQVKKAYREIIADEGKLTEHVRLLRTIFLHDGTLRDLIGFPTCFVTTEQNLPGDSR